MNGSGSGIGQDWYAVSDEFDRRIALLVTYQDRRQLARNHVVQGDNVIAQLMQETESAWEIDVVRGPRHVKVVEHVCDVRLSTSCACFRWCSCVYLPVLLQRFRNRSRELEFSCDRRTPP